MEGGKGITFASNIDKKVYIRGGTLRYIYIFTNLILTYRD